MSSKIKILFSNIRLIVQIYIITSFLELFLNREFLVGVLPLGMAGVNMSKSLIFYYMFYAGAIFYGMIFVLQFIILVMAGIFGKVSRLSKGLLWSIFYLTILLDLAHVIEGVNNTDFNAPILASFIYTVLIIATSILIIKDTSFKIMYILIIPDILAFQVLLGSWLVELFKNTIFDPLIYYSGQGIAYSVIITSIVFIIYSALISKDLKYFIPSSVIGLIIGLLAWFNVIPGLAIGLGFTFPYILGFLGIRNWMPPVILPLGLIALFGALALRKKNPKLAYATLSLLGGALIFDSISTTTYMLIPLISVTLASLL